MNIQKQKTKENMFYLTLSQKAHIACPQKCHNILPLLASILTLILLFLLQIKLLHYQKFRTKN